MMRRMLALLLLCCLLTTCVAAQADGAELTWQRAVDMALYMREIAMGDFLAINGVPEELQSTVRNWVEGIDENPVTVARLRVEDGRAMKMLMPLMRMEPEIVQLEARSSVMGAELGALIFDSCLQEQTRSVHDGMIAGEEVPTYNTVMEVNTLCRFEMIYAEEAPEGSDEFGLYLVVYDDAASALILASAENGAVSLTGMLLPLESLRRLQNYGHVALWTFTISHPVTCEEVLPE